MPAKSPDKPNQRHKTGKRRFRPAQGQCQRRAGANADASEKPRQTKPASQTKQTLSTSTSRTDLFFPVNINPEPRIDCCARIESGGINKNRRKNKDLRARGDLQ
jgi:hypothetical protein